MKTEDYIKSVIAVLLYILLLVLVSLQHKEPTKHTTPLGITNFIFDLPMNRKGSGIR
jgi:hypothetical protein|tara:strand:- start:190 stop:360 length:171 start_codon:yes stop_codon:yes gene_type:complete